MTFTVFEPHPATPDPEDEPPWEEMSTPPRTAPNDLEWQEPYAPGEPDDEPRPWVNVPPEYIAYYVHCQCGMEPLAFIRWLCGELETLKAIDPYCSK